MMDHYTMRALGLGLLLFSREASGAGVRESTFLHFAFSATDLTITFRSLRYLTHVDHPPSLVIEKVGGTGKHRTGAIDEIE